MVRRLEIDLDEFQRIVTDPKASRRSRTLTPSGRPSRTPTGPRPKGRALTHGFRGQHAGEGTRDPSTRHTR